MIKPLKFKYLIRQTENKRFELYSFSNLNKIIYYFVIILIFLLSFLFYSSLFYPVLGSDQAVTILIVHYFKLPHDLYFWGQDRMGSFIPLIAQIPYKLFNCSALVSEAITHYVILLSGFLAFSTFIKSNFYKIVFCIIWFLPPWRFVDLTQLAFGIHYSLIAISCYLINLTYKEAIQKRWALYHFILFLTTILLISSVWVTDMAMLSVLILLCVLIYYFLKDHKLSWSTFRKPEIYYTLAGLILGYLFIHYAKSISQGKHEYSAIGDLHTVFQTSRILIISIKELLLFKAEEPFTSVYTYMVLIIIIFTLKNIRKARIKLHDKVNNWFLFFLIDAVVIFSAIICAKWTYESGVPRRYFICAYVALSYVFILINENIVSSRKQNILKIFIALTVLTGGVGTIYNMKYIYPKTLTPKVKIVGEFQKLGRIGIISGYWESYITSCVNPDLIKATPYDSPWSVAKNEEIIEEVFRQPKLYIIKDNWLDIFNDTIQQYGRTLIKDGNEFRMGDCCVCEYKKLIK